MLVLICIYVGAIYGGSRIGDPAQHPGHAGVGGGDARRLPARQQGLAGRAMGIATSGSVLGTLFGMFFLALFTPILGKLALKFGAYEFFWLALFGVIIAGTLTGDDPLKGYIAGLLGIFIAIDRPGAASTPTSASPSAAATWPAASASCRRWSARSASPRC